MFSCPIEYKPERGYTRQEMIELIKPQRQLLCFFAQTAGYRRGVLGLDFGNYDRQKGSVPVYVMGEAEAQVLSKAEGRKFKKGYQSSGLGKAIMVTHSTTLRAGYLRVQVVGGGLR